MCGGVKEQNESPRLLSARTAQCPTADAGVLAQQVVVLGDEAVAPVPAKVLVFEAVELCTDAELQPCPEVRLVDDPHSPQTRRRACSPTRLDGRDPSLLRNWGRAPMGRSFGAGLRR